MTYSFTYNDEGIRTSKSANGNTTTYYYSGGLLIGESNNTETFVYIYDAEGSPLGMRYRLHTQASGSWTTYWFEKNMLGDIVAVYNSSGTKILSYKYDAWGNFTSTTHAADSIGGASKNPFRYRGYYYDSETGFYYVSSRYYDPEIGRFINADSQLNQKDGILGYNMFAYCHNNPIMYSDPTGHSITLACIIIGAVIGAVAGGCAGAYVSKKQTGKVNGWAVAAGAVGGGVVGGLVGWGVGAAITAVGAAATGSAATAAAPVVQQVAEKASTALQTYYPPNDGFSGAVQKITLEAGTLIQRTGDLVGRYIAPAGTPTQMLSLPYDKIGQPTTILQVQQSVEVLAGRVAPWFGQIGGGIQYQLGTPLDQLISEGIIKIFGG